MISVIIPTLNEERALPATLARVLTQDGEFEVLVVDGGSRDHTRTCVGLDPRIHLLSAPTGRASQMNAGAQQARGEWLLFLHADTLLPDGALRAIGRLPVNVQAGGFRHRFSGNARGLRTISWLHNFRCRRTRVFYGDQAPFIRTGLFRRLGGYPEQAVLEDLLFGERVAASTRPLLLALTVVTDSRKFEQQGVWRSLWRVLVILACHHLRLPMMAREFFINVR
jgi:rSAM/selenodomain-associated transferase 2